MRYLRWLTGLSTTENIGVTGVGTQENLGGGENGSFGGGRLAVTIPSSAVSLCSCLTETVKAPQSIHTFAEP